MIKLARSVIGTEEMQEVQRVMTLAFLGMGKEVKQFEEELGSYLGGEKRVICVNTGTAALHLAAQSIGLKAGDEVLVPSLTFVSTFQAISATGAKPIACDIDSTTGFIDLNDAARRITPNTKAIFPVHYAGATGNLMGLYDLARSHKLRVVEDAAHAFGTSYDGKKIGSFGDIICFSFDGIKNITSGEGGAIVTSDPQVINDASDLRLLGVMKDSEKRYQNQRSWEFDVTAQGWRYHMSDIMAAIGRVQLRRFETEFKPKRLEMAKLYRKLLADCTGIRFFEMHPGTVPFMMPIRVLDHRRDPLRKYLLENQVEVGIHYKPNHLLSFYGGGKISLPVAETLYSELLSLPFHPQLGENDIHQVCEQIMSFLKDPERMSLRGARGDGAIALC